MRKSFLRCKERHIPMKVESNCIRMRLYFDSKQTLLSMQTDSTSPTAVANCQLSHRRIIIKVFTYLRYLSKEIINRS